MGDYDAGRQKMAKRSRWHKIVASSLVKENEVLSRENERLNGLVKDERERHKQILKIAIQEKRALKTKCDQLSVNPFAANLDAVRHAAAQQRIKDLEKEVEYLRKRLNGK